LAKRQLDELRTAEQLERHFSRRDLFTMYVNRVYFAEDEIGAQNASQRLFGKNPADLDISQAALLAGMIRSPSRFSPYKHPDRAMLRRNEVIDAMIAANMISSADGESAKSNALRGSPVQPPTQGQNPP
jgi:membrane peptidoglycan carboxypeptidase